MEKTKTNNTIQKKIVILFLIDFVLSKYGFIGGTEKQLIDKINRLDKRTFTPILLCLQKRFHNHVWDSIDCEKIVLHIYSLSSLKNLISFFKFLNILKVKKVDIIEAVFFDSIIIGVIIGCIAGVKKIITCRRDMGYWYNKKIKYFLSFINKYTDSVLANANAIKRNVIENEKIKDDKVDVIYNGIDLKRIEVTKKANLCKEFTNIDEGDKIVGIVANFNRNVKRIDVFIKAIKYVIKKNKKVMFIIIGEGNLKSELTDLSKEWNVSDFLIWAGTKIDPLPYIKNFDIGVISSDSEGFSNAILEYMASGIPVIATDVGGNRELVKDGITGFLVPKGDHVSLAKRIIQLLENDELAKKLGKNSKVEVYNKYSWEKIINDYERYYYNLVIKKV